MQEKDGDDRLAFSGEGEADGEVEVEGFSKPDTTEVPASVDNTPECLNKALDGLSSRSAAALQWKTSFYYKRGRNLSDFHIVIILQMEELLDTCHFVSNNDHWVLLNDLGWTHHANTTSKCQGILQLLLQSQPSEKNSK